MIALLLKQMSRAEKLIALEAILEDLSRDDQAIESPAWHAEALKQTEERVASGAEKFIDWEIAKQQFRSV